MKRQAGVSLAEILVVLAVMGIVLGAAPLFLSPMETPLTSGTSVLEGFFREARMKAISNTSAYRVSTDAGGRLVAEHAKNCSETTWTVDPQMRRELPRGVSTAPDGWSTCFSSRGISSSNLVVTLSHPDHGSVDVEVLVGGTTRVLE